MKAGQYRALVAALAAATTVAGAAAPVFADDTATKTEATTKAETGKNPSASSGIQERAVAQAQVRLSV